MAWITQSDAILRACTVPARTLQSLSDSPIYATFQCAQVITTDCSSSVCLIWNCFIFSVISSSHCTCNVPFETLQRMPLDTPTKVSMISNSFWVIKHFTRFLHKAQRFCLSNYCIVWRRGVIKEPFFSSLMLNITWIIYWDTKGTNLTTNIVIFNIETTNTFFTFNIRSNPVPCKVFPKQSLSQFID